jgi:hypothetical protein
MDKVTVFDLSVFWQGALVAGILLNILGGSVSCGPSRDTTSVYTTSVTLRDLCKRRAAAFSLSLDGYGAALSYAGLCFDVSSQRAVSPKPPSEGRSLAEIFLACF